MGVTGDAAGTSPWVVLDRRIDEAALARALALAVGGLHGGTSAAVQLPAAGGDVGRAAADAAISTAADAAARHGAEVLHWPATGTARWHELDAAVEAAAASSRPTLLVAPAIDRRPRPDRARCVARALASLRRLDRLGLALGLDELAPIDEALAGVDDPSRPAFVLLATYEDEPLRPSDAGDTAAVLDVIAETEPQVDDWVTALQPVQALRAAATALDVAACGHHEDLAPALEALALAQALHRHDAAAEAALALAGELGASETARSLAAAQVHALEAVLRLDAAGLRRGVADRHDALERARAASGGGLGGVPMIDGITGLAAVIGVVADAPARAPIGPVDATLLAYADRLGPSAERTPPDPAGDAWGALREACATAWSALSRSELGIAWWHIALLASWPQARAAGWDETGDLLRAALAFFGAQGFDDLAAAARAALRAQGARVPRRGRGSSVVPAVLARCGVTSREMDVLCQLDDGVSNKEIAAALYLSPRTVSHHISSMLAKTGLTTRRDLVALARELDLAATSPRMLR